MGDAISFLRLLLIDELTEGEPSCGHDYGYTQSSNYDLVGVGKERVMTCLQEGRVTLALAYFFFFTQRL